MSDVIAVSVKGVAPEYVVRLDTAAMRKVFPDLDDCDFNQYVGVVVRQIRQAWSQLQPGDAFIHPEFVTVRRENMNGVKTIQTAEGEKYEAHYEGRSKMFDDREQAYRVLLLHAAKDAGRQLTPEEESQLLTSDAQNSMLDDASRG